MKKDCKLTIIVLCYNHEKYLEDAINSIKKQKCNFPFEIIIGDDASTDNSQKLIKKLTKDISNVQLVLRDKNLGATKNLYDLYMRSNGEYITVLESDDYWIDENKLQKQVDFLDNHPEYIGVSHKICGIDINGNKTNDYPVWIKKEGDTNLNDFLNNKYFSLTSTVYKNIYLEYKKDNKFKKLFFTDKIVADLIVCIELLKRGKIKLLVESMAAYRVINNENSSNYNSIRNLFQKCEDHINLLNAIDDYHGNKINLKEIYNSWLSQGLYYSLMNKNINLYKILRKKVKNKKYLSYHNFNFWKIYLNVIMNKIKR